MFYCFFVILISVEENYKYGIFLLKLDDGRGRRRFLGVDRLVVRENGLVVRDSFFGEEV